MTDILHFAFLLENLLFGVLTEMGRIVIKIKIELA